VRAEPRRAVPQHTLERMLRPAFPGRRIAGIEPLPDGRRNAGFKVRLEGAGDPIVLRIYEHDPSLWRKELDLIRLVAGTVPVPDVIHAEPGGSEELPPFALLRFVDGITFRELRRGSDRQAIAQAARSVGQTLAAIGRFEFPASGWLGPGPAVTAALLEGPDPFPRFVDRCLASTVLQQRLPADLCERTHRLGWSRAPELAGVADESRLEHGDFNKRNLLVAPKGGRWSVAAVLDWEFAVSGTPLGDLGSFLRHEQTGRPLVEPHFSEGYRRAGGTLPDGWRRLARLIDLTALCESLTHDNLPDAVVAELVELVRATVEDRDPRLG
jgi:aminoglycoside phosphotransferase (APT) family kinase protein